MSSFGGGKGSGSGRRGPPPPAEERISSRPSVFERLGVRRDRDHGGGDRERDRSWQGEQPIRSSSSSLNRRGGPSGSDIHSASASSKRKSTSFSPSPPPPKHIKEKGKSKQSDAKKLSSSGRSNKEKDKDKKLIKKVLAKQKRKQKAKKLQGKGKKDGGSSISSIDNSSSGEEESSSTSGSISSSTSGTASSSLSDDDSSDSSVPSIKLRASDRKKKDKGKGIKESKKMMMKEKDKVIRSKGQGAGGGSSSASASSTPVAGDLREKLNAHHHHHHHHRDRDGRDHRSRSPMLKEKGRGGYDDTPRKRPILDTYPPPYEDPHVKRRKVTSPSPGPGGYPPPVGIGRSAPPPPHHHHSGEDYPPHHRRAPPPPERERPIVPPPHSRSPYKAPYHDRVSPARFDPRRVDDRARNSPYVDRRKDPLPPHPGSGYDRPKDRGLIPTPSTRPPVVHDSRYERGPERERPFPPAPGDFPHRHPPRVPPAPAPYEYPRTGGDANVGRRAAPYESRERERDHEPLIPKTKEALAERYNNEQVKKSGYNIDKWVDETVRHRSGGLDEVGVSTPFSSASSRSPEREREKEVKVGKPEQIAKDPIPPPVVVDAEDLSDFSDDADEILLNTETGLKEPEGGIEVELGEKKIEEKERPKTPEPSTKPVKDFTSLEEPLKKKEPCPSPTKKLPPPQPSIPPQVHPHHDPSIPSQSQTDDDILDRMDFEEISDDELGAGGELENSNKVKLVDALGVDWASLVCQEKKKDEVQGEAPKKGSARERWRPLNVLKSIGLSKSLLGEELAAKLTLDEENKSNEQEGMSKDVLLLDKVGLGPNSRALSSRRDMAFRRHLLGLPPKNLVDLDPFRNSSNNSASTPELDTIGELYKTSIALLKASS